MAAFIISIAGTEISKEGPAYVILIFAICATAGTVGAIFITERLKKTEYGEKNKKVKKPMF